ncbi:SubName: Full=Uncharacterized protein {ECO:0000313/EMBL:CCA71152.1} [Serendipita indica DSM 11827]|nr:SubName: Full=Uncharacterized protein {ECO:0000313/EMBL:CCA71152.1} [Serendipita indica DSM 11827]
MSARDEFNTQPSHHLSRDDEDSAFSVAPKYSELRTTIESRKAVVGVCRMWYALGIQRLWSHVVIYLSNPHIVVDSIVKALRSNPPLASHVRRLTISSSPYQGGVTFTQNENHELRSDLLLIISKFTNLEIIYSPSDLIDSSVNTHLPSLSILLLQRAWSNFLSTSPNLTLPWLTIRALVLNLGGALPGTSSGESVCFPNLTHLEIRASQYGVIRYVGELWESPRLEELILKSCFYDEWRKFIDRNRDRLETLSLFHIYAGQTPPWHGTMLLPRLYRLSTSDPTMIMDHLTAPKLTELYIPMASATVRLPQAFRSMLVSTVDALIQQFPVVKTIGVSGKNGKPLQPQSSADAIHHEDMEKWLKQGVIVNVRQIIHPPPVSPLVPASTPAASKESRLRAMWESYTSPNIPYEEGRPTADFIRLVREFMSKPLVHEYAKYECHALHEPLQGMLLWQGCWALRTGPGSLVLIHGDSASTVKRAKDSASARAIVYTLHKLSGDEERLDGHPWLVRRTTDIW